MNDILKPSVSLLSKLGSIAAHVEEWLSPSGHPFDRIGLDKLLADPEVREWMDAMDREALIPRKR